MDTKLCANCGFEKPVTEFHPDNRTKKPRSRCKVCTNAENVARAAANPERATARTNAWRKANPGRASAISRAWQLRHPEQFKAMIQKGRYNIDFDAMLAAQAGLCASCLKPMRSSGKEPDSVCVDHDRSCCPGKKSCGKCVRGLIHRNCNLVLGYANDDLQVLRSAVSYLEKWSAQPSC
jgi:hypothetical protein